MKTCAVCVLPSTFPGISFDENGVCNFCAQWRETGDTPDDKDAYLHKFTALMKDVPTDSGYDCTLAYSGGKDSTYTLYVLASLFKLKVLALTFDNGFISDQAFRNIRTVAERLGADSMIIKPDFGLLRKIFSSAREQELYAPKTLERASTICTSCIGMAKFMFLRIALEKNIPVMAWGWTPGQAPLRSSIMKLSPSLYRQNQEAILKPLERIAGPAIRRYFLTDDMFTPARPFPWNVSPLAFMDYDEEAILRTINDLGWVAPEALDANSTNCLLNSYANRIHCDRYGFHPYAFEIAGMVRRGVMTRAEGLKKMEEPLNQGTVAAVKKKLGIDV